MMAAFGDIAVVVVLAAGSAMHAAALVMLVFLLRDSRVIAAETAQLTKQVQDWLDAQDEATRKRHAAILREFGLD